MGRASRCPAGSITSSMYGIANAPQETGYCCSTSTIQPTPNLSCTIPNFGEKNVLIERHLDLAAVAERGEQLVGFAFGLHREREREALELRLALGVAVGRHDALVAELEARMHDGFGCFGGRAGSSGCLGARDCP